MRKVIYITIYLLIGLYIAWDQTVLLDIDPSPSQESGHYGWKMAANDRYPNYMRERYPQDLQEDWKTVESSMALLFNQDSLIPFDHIGGKRFQLITIGEKLPIFESTLKLYAKINAQHIASPSIIQTDHFRSYNQLIIGLNQTSFSEEEISSLQRLNELGSVSFINFKGLELLQQIGKTDRWLQAYSPDSVSQAIAAQVLFGGIGVSAQIPVMTSMYQMELLGETTTPHRLAYVPAEYYGIDADSLNRIAEVVEEGILNYAMPGCQVLVAKSGKVVYNKSFGYHTYKRERAVDNSDLYDLASVTKVAATTLASMKVYDEGLLNLNAPLQDYFKQKRYASSSIRVSDTVTYNRFMAELAFNQLAGLEMKQDMDTVRFQDSLMIVNYTRGFGRKRTPPVMRVKIKDLLTHRSGLQSSLPIPTSLRRGSAYQQYRATNAANWVLLPHAYEDTLWNMARQLEVNSGGYRYSDINMMLMHRALDSLTGQSLNRFLFEQYYKDLGLQTMSFNPLRIYELERIVPTERSTSNNSQFLQGVVHDPIARLSGGVAGHAGLFSNANDLAILMQMLLNGGEYGGKSFLDPYTVKRFTYSGRDFRGLGFNTVMGSAIHAPSASLNTFGHTGFTGTCVWVDPEHELVFVFLANRVHPTSNNQRLNELQIRERIHQVIYDELGITPPVRKFRKASPIIAARESIEKTTVQELVAIEDGSGGR